ncbi:MAG: cysteine synthase A [Candidatus Hodarchaeota archaeon]
MTKKLYNNIIETIGATPLVKLNNIVPEGSANIYAKCENFNPGSSVKDRIAISMIDAAEKAGIIKLGDTIVEPTSGNTGIGLALVCAAKGYRLKLTMPESMSLERRKILKAFGAELVLTPASGGMPGAIKKAQELQDADKAIYIPQQFKNEANPKVHYETTGPEIYEALEGKIDAFIAGIGTGGTITGAGKYLRERLGDKLKIVAIEPKGSPVLTGGQPGPHKIQGIGAGFIPDVLDTKIYDEVRKVDFEEAVMASRKLASNEGIFVGISAGAATHIALAVAKELGPGKNIVMILPDTGERYLSNPLWEEL